MSHTASTSVWMGFTYRQGQSRELVLIVDERPIDDIFPFDYDIFGEDKQEILGFRNWIGNIGVLMDRPKLIVQNAHDSFGVKKFKSRALKRHETFNGMTKRFGCLDGRFRHGSQKFATCFEAVCVLCQYQIEQELPLFDVLIEAIMDE
ncbi:hypothetical protein IV203_028172 [Nitzschia inconspicua]|uniref:Uncharacterized protein n=1 Tax=Nitzschia inconspicua TaxID=303405 RepID=A0A9K3KJ49_9STRA|nr:hypothetical protein IV203_033485 [Nitzschia inconspicua]KAG7337038.1 hypothetical protein IV203_022802 [Nitzschia inconspicua]KAG7342568.1 hypothetical protein IV203_007661 [Nitzschia inconspicua]KAG7344674.1 hypothetical protein IV203_032205 [Nitzschia inconspicua]KAG7354647.1 hypothetical protein IV203_004003 [Nitzschia inconspicua]